MLVCTSTAPAPSFISPLQAIKAFHTRNWFVSLFNFCVRKGRKPIRKRKPHTLSLSIHPWTWNLWKLAIVVASFFFFFIFRDRRIKSKMICANLIHGMILLSAMQNNLQIWTPPNCIQVGILYNFFAAIKNECLLNDSNWDFFFLPCVCLCVWVGGWVELGHYIPELAKAIVDGNKEASSLKINLKGFMVRTTHTQWI